MIQYRRFFREEESSGCEGGPSPKVTRSNSRHLCFVTMARKRKVLSVFVDESGKFQFPDPQSRFYIVGMVLHDQSFDAAGLIARLEADWLRMGLSDFCFHAGPLVRKEKGYRYMPREQRTAIFARMMLFARQMQFAYHCLVVDKKFVTSADPLARLPSLGCFMIHSSCGLVRRSSSLSP